MAAEPENANVIFLKVDVDAARVSLSLTYFLMSLQKQLDYFSCCQACASAEILDTSLYSCKNCCQTCLWFLQHFMECSPLSHQNQRHITGLCANCKVTSFIYWENYERTCLCGFVVLSCGVGCSLRAMYKDPQPAGVTNESAERIK